MIESEQRLVCLSLFLSFFFQSEVLHKGPVPERPFRVLLSAADLNCTPGWLSALSPLLFTLVTPFCF